MVSNEHWMSEAIAQARRGLGQTTPNPPVGCVLVSEDQKVLLGAGYHGRAGGPHAEVRAIEDALTKGNDIRGATAFVTLEPCSHQGKTPPCVQRLKEEGISKILIGHLDPNPSSIRWA